MSEEKRVELVVVAGTEANGVPAIEQQLALAAEFVYRQRDGETGITLQNLRDPEIPENCTEMAQDTKHGPLRWDYTMMRGVPIEGANWRDVIEHIKARGFHLVSASVADQILKKQWLLSPEAFKLRIEGRDVHDINDYEIYFLGSKFLSIGVGYRGAVKGIKWNAEAKRWVPVTRSLSGPWNGKQIAFTHADAAQPGWSFDTVFKTCLALAVAGAASLYFFTQAYFSG